MTTVERKHFHFCAASLRSRKQTALITHLQHLAYVLRELNSNRTRSKIRNLHPPKIENRARLLLPPSPFGVPVQRRAVTESSDDVLFHRRPRGIESARLDTRRACLSVDCCCRDEDIGAKATVYFVTSPEARFQHAKQCESRVVTADHRQKGSNGQCSFNRIVNARHKYALLYFVSTIFNLCSTCVKTIAACAASDPATRPLG